MRKSRQPPGIVDIIRQVDREEGRKVRRKRAAPSPIDLDAPLGEREWNILRRLRKDERYRSAIAMVRARYGITANPLLLPRTLKETMARHGIDLAEAVVLVADGQQEHRVG